MSQQNKKIELLGNVPMPKALLAMGLPTMIGMMINALYSLADAYFVGGLGTSQMGAITVAFPLGQVVVGLGLLFGSGAASYISRQLGSGDRESADRAASTALYGGILTGTVVICCMMVFLRPLLGRLGATESIMPYAVSYAEIYVVASIFNVFNVTMNSIVTSEGAAKTTMLVLLAGAVLNIVLDPVFIYTFHLGVAGAALATAISQAVSAAVYLIYIGKKKSIFGFQIKKCSFSGNIISEILKIGVPTLVFQLLTSLSIGMMNDQAGKYGDSIVAALGLVTRMMSMGSLMVFGFIKGFQPIAGYSYGAGKIGRLREAVKVSLIWSTVFCTVFGILTAIFAGGIVSQFTRADLEMIRVGERALRANGLSFILFGFYTVYSALLLALGKAKEGLLLGACRQGICFVPMMICLPKILGLSGIIYAQPAADVLSAAATVFVALKLLYRPT